LYKIIATQENKIESAFEMLEIAQDKFDKITQEYEVKIEKYCQ